MATLSVEEVKLLVEEINQQRGKYIKQVLANLEKISGGKVDPAVRKAVLDGMNNYTRAIHMLVGYTVEV